MIAATVALRIELRKERFETSAHHLATLVESRLHHTAEQTLIATAVFHIVARHAHHGTLHLGRRIEHSRFDGEKIFHVIPQLHQDTQDAIRLIAWLSRKTLCHFFLNHACAAGNEVAIVEHFEKNLARDVVRIITRKHERASVEHMFEVHFQEVVLNDALSFELRISLSEVSHTLKINLCHFHLTLFRQEVLCEHTHTRSHFQNGKFGTSIYRVGDGTCHIQIFQKVLSKEFFRAYGFHSTK